MYLYWQEIESSHSISNVSESYIIGKKINTCNIIGYSYTLFFRKNTYS